MSQVITIVQAERCNMVSSHKDVSMSERTSSGIIIFVGMLLVALMPPLVLIFAFSASLIPIAIGAAAWAIALGIKIPLIILTDRILESEIIPSDSKLTALLNGMVSAIAELGISAFCFFVIFPNIPFVDIVGFGAGASSIEILLISTYVMIIKDQQNSAKIEVWSAGAKKSQCVRYMTIIERIVALIGHVGSRGLVYLSIFYDHPDLAVVAFIAFSATDGIANYGKTKKWNWFDPKTCKQFYCLLFLIGLIEICIFVVSFALLQNN